MSQPNPTQTFLQEAEDLLDQIEATALELQPGQNANESVHHLFRAFHTIKGSGAMFGFDAVAAFTHHVETALDKVREGTVPISADLIQLILASADQIKAMLNGAQGDSKAEPGGGDRIIAALEKLLSPAKAETTAPAPNPPSGVAPAAASSEPAAPRQSFRIQFRPCPGLMVSGTNPALLLDELRSLGECAITAKADAVPGLEGLQPDQCYLRWDIRLSTAKGINAIKDVFIFVEEGSELAIQEVPRGAPASPAREESVASIPPTGGSTAPAKAAESGTGEEVHAAGPRKPTEQGGTVRVPSERLDRLVALVGEMVMNQSRLTQVAAGAALPNLTAPVEELERLVSELRDTVLGIRMMPIGTTFGRYKRLVHDLSAELGKDIDLVTEGAETELDKTVLDRLGDPLIHLLRNSIDHGIEPAAEREQRGKARRGVIRLAAAHTGSNVVITIQDDGRGLDTEAIRAKAVEKQLITPEAALSEDAIFNLVFLPGFSTAKQVTSVSGRGVGMDVVKRQMDALRGSIQLASAVGRGTTVTLTLPLTLAIIDGLLVEVAQDQFIIPMSAVAENVELPRNERARHNGRNAVAVRGALIPYIRLREEFGIAGEELDVEKIVIVRHGAERVGLLVDRVLGSHQTVIQSLGRFYRNIEVVSGATIMGDGRVALILDLGGVIRHAGSGNARGPLKTPGDF